MNKFKPKYFLLKKKLKYTKSSYNVFMSKYCLQFAKCKNIDCCKPLRSNVHEVLVGKFLPTPLVIFAGPQLFNPEKKSQKRKPSGFYENLCSTKSAFKKLQSEYKTSLRLVLSFNMLITAMKFKTNMQFRNLQTDHRQFQASKISWKILGTLFMNKSNVHLMLLCHKQKISLYTSIPLIFVPL